MLEATEGARLWRLNNSPALGLDSLLAKPKVIVIVDDVVTKGRMMLATAAHLAGRFPEAELRGFALVRTMGLQPDVEKIIASTVGVIRYHAGEALRVDDQPAEPPTLF